MLSVGSTIAQRRRARKLLSALKWAGSVCALLCLCFAAYAGLRALSVQPPSPPRPTQNGSSIAAAFEQGQWAEGSRLLRESLQMDPTDAGVQALYAEFTRPLKVDLEFHVSRAIRQGSTRSADMLLTQDDRYWLVLKVFSPCYLYVLQHTSAGAILQLFPNAQHSSLTNPLQPGTLNLPEHLDDFRLADDVPGTETIYAVASPWQQKKLEKLLQQASQGTDGALRQSATEEIMAMLEGAAEQTALIPALAFLSYSFRHEALTPGASAQESSLIPLPGTNSYPSASLAPLATTYKHGRCVLCERV